MHVDAQAHSESEEWKALGKQSIQRVESVLMRIHPSGDKNSTELLPCNNFRFKQHYIDQQSHTVLMFPLQVLSQGLYLAKLQPTGDQNKFWWQIN